MDRAEANHIPFLEGKQLSDRGLAQGRGRKLED